MDTPAEEFGTPKHVNELTREQIDAEQRAQLAIIGDDTAEGESSRTTDSVEEYTIKRLELECNKLRQENAQLRDGTNQDRQRSEMYTLNAKLRGYEAQLKYQAAQLRRYQRAALAFKVLQTAAELVANDLQGSDA